MINDNQDIKEDGYVYFRFLAKDELRVKVKEYLSALPDDNQQNKVVLKSQDIVNYKKVIEINEADRFLEDVKNTNLTLYRINVGDEINNTEVVLKKIQDHAYIILEHELKMRFLFDQIPWEWNDEAQIKKDFYDYFSVQVTSNFIMMEEKNNVRTVASSPRGNYQRYMGYIFCSPSSSLLKFCEHMLEDYELDIKELPVLMRKPFIIKTELMNHLDRTSFRGFVKRRSDLLVVRISKIINYYLDEVIYEEDESSKFRFDEWIQGLSIEPYDSLIDNFNIDFYETAVRMPDT